MLTQRTGRRFQVLLSQQTSDITGHQSILRHAFGVHPNTHTVGVTQLHHVAHTLDTLDTGYYVDIKVVTQEVLVVETIGTNQ